MVWLFIVFLDAHPTPDFVKLDGVKREGLHSSVEYFGSLSEL